MNPLLLDPTRTGLLRRRFEKELARRFNRVRQKINQLLIEEDAFGMSRKVRDTNPLLIAANEQHKFSSVLVSLPQDIAERIREHAAAINSDDLAEKGREQEPHITVRYGLHADKADEVRGVIESFPPTFYVVAPQVSIFEGEEFDVVKLDVHSPDLHKIHEALGKIPHTDTHAEYKPHITLAYVQPGKGKDYLHLKFPPLFFRSDYLVFSDKEHVQTSIPLSNAFVYQNSWGTWADRTLPDGSHWSSLVGNTRWMFLTQEQQLEQFKQWLQSQLLIEVLTKGTDYKDYWLTKYISDAYEKGMGRAFDDVRKPALAQRLDFYAGTKKEFLDSSFRRPVAANRVKLLASRTLTDLQGVTDAMAQAMSRELVDGMIKGESPRVVARNITKHVDNIGKKRALMIARTETVRAHNEGALDALETLGVTDIGVMVEWSTAKDFRVCPECRALQGIVIKVSEARKQVPLPRHPNCRCSYVPANVGESRKGQIRGKGRIEAAIDRSIRAEMPKKKKRTLAEQKRRTRWGGADARINKNRPKATV